MNEICRISVIKEFDRVILGRDISKVLKEGHVYNITEIIGVLMIEDLGEHATIEKHSGSSLQTLLSSGVHCLTKEEHEKQKYKKLKNI